MKRIVIFVSILMIATIIISACGQSGPIQPQGKEVKVLGGSYWDINPEQLNSMLESKDFPLVNVHIPYAREIPQTDLFIPYNQIEENLSQFPQDKEAKIVLYCRSGPMSATAARTLVKSGYSNVWNLDGGMAEWEKQGYEIIRNP